MVAARDAGQTRRPHAHPPADLRRGVGQVDGEPAAIPARPHDESAPKDRARAGLAEIDRDRSRRRLSLRERRGMSIRSATVLRWVLWVGLLTIATQILIRARVDIEQSHVVLTMILIVLGGSAAGGRWLGF